MSFLDKKIPGTENDARDGTFFGMSFPGSAAHEQSILSNAAEGRRKKIQGEIRTLRSGEAAGITTPKSVIQDEIRTLRSQEASAPPPTVTPRYDPASVQDEFLKNRGGVTSENIDAMRNAGLTLRSGQTIVQELPRPTPEQERAQYAFNQTSPIQAQATTQWVQPRQTEFTGTEGKMSGFLAAMMNQANRIRGEKQGFKAFQDNVREQNQNYRTGLSDTTQRRGQDLQQEGVMAGIGERRYATDVGADVQRRGQDITQEGNLLQNQAARARLTLDAARDIRDYEDKELQAIAPRVYNPETKKFEVDENTLATAIKMRNDLRDAAVANGGTWQGLNREGLRTATYANEAVRKENNRLVNKLNPFAEPVSGPDTIEDLAMVGGKSRISEGSGNLQVSRVARGLKEGDALRSKIEQTASDMKAKGATTEEIQAAIAQLRNK